LDIADIKDTQAIYVCDHIFGETREVGLFGREPDGPLVVTCGCEVDKAHVVGFGHLRNRLKAILSAKLPEKGHALRLNPNESKWVAIS